MGPVVEEGGSGQLAASAVETPLRRLRAGIRSCYESSLRLDSTLRGRIDVVFTVAESGRVSSASVQGMDARPELASCVSGRFRGLVVVPHPEGGSVSLRVSYVLSTR